jgi:hypothetical protein
MFLQARGKGLSSISRPESLFCQAVVYIAVIRAEVLWEDFVLGCTLHKNYNQVGFQEDNAAIPTERPTDPTPDVSESTVEPAQTVPLPNPYQPSLTSSPRNTASMSILRDWYPCLEVSRCRVLASEIIDNEIQGCLEQHTTHSKLKKWSSVNAISAMPVYEFQ